MKPNQHRRFQSIRGFTLIEVMVVVAIIGLLAAIALPSYADYIRKSRRADGIAAILSLQLAQEKFRGNCIEYAGDMADPEVCDNTTPGNNRVKHLSTSSDGHYTLAISGESATDYIITATPQGAQGQDPCKNFVLTVNGGSAIESVSGTDNRCWQR